MLKIGIIGCGNLGLSLLKGIHKHAPETQIWGSKRNITNLPPLQNVYYTTSNEELILNTDILILALKPAGVIPFMKAFGHLINQDQILISAATGVSITELKSNLPKDIECYRAMPNTASSVNESMTMIAGIPGKSEHINQVEELFKSIGQTIIINEELMEAATVIGACGIAYVLRFMRAMIQGGIEVGFDSATATKIVSQTIKGAAQLIIENGRHPEEEIDRVTTPKGVTIVGLNEMEHSGFSSALIKGIVSSYKKIEK